MEDTNEVDATLDTAMSELTIAQEKQEICEEMLSRDRKKIYELQNREIPFDQVEENISLLSVKLKETHFQELGSLDSVSAIVGVQTTNQVDHAKELKHSKSVKRRERRAQHVVAREQRIKGQGNPVSDRVVKSEKLKRKLEPVGLIIDEINPDGAQKVNQICQELGNLNLVEDNNEQPRKKVRNAIPATEWISIYNARKRMKQRYHYNITDSRLAQHVERGKEDGLFISCVSSCNNLWAIIMDAGTSFTSQVYEISPFFLHKEWIMEQWEKNYYITAVSGSTNGSSLVVMSKGSKYNQQSYKVSGSFPFKWIKQKWDEGFHVTSMATAGTRWVVVMSKNAGYSNQVVEFDSCYISEGIHKRWDSGHRITCVGATSYQAALIWSVPRRKPSDQAQETLHTSLFPTLQGKENRKKNLYISCMCYGRTASLNAGNAAKECPWLGET